MTLNLRNLAFVGSLAPRAVWNARTDLAASLAAGATNPNGRWRYGRKTPSLVFSQLSSFNGSGWFGNSSFNTPLIYVATGDALDSHVPVGSADEVSLRWTAPSAMTISIDVSVSKSTTGGDGVLFTLRTTSNVVLNSSGVIHGPSGLHNYFNPSLVVASGQVLDFDVSRNGTDAFDNFRYERVIISQIS